MHFGNPFLPSGVGEPSEFQKKKEGVNKIKGMDRMKVVFNVGSDTSLGLAVAIPYDRKEQFSELWKKYPKIKNDFLMKVQPEEMKGWVKRRDFTAIKKKILEIVNDNLERPIKTLYLESFSYN